MREEIRTTFSPAAASTAALEVRLGEISEHEQEERRCSPHSEQTRLTNLSLRQYGQIPTPEETDGCFRQENSDGVL